MKRINFNTVFLCLAGSLLFASDIFGQNGIGDTPDIRRTSRYYMDDANMTDSITRISYLTPINRSTMSMLPASTGQSYGGNDMMRMGNRHVNAVANTVPGVMSIGGQTPSIRGARTDGTAYFVDGLRVYGGLPGGY
jgi:hypothetical protein